MSSLRTVTLIGANGDRLVLACSTEPHQLGLGGQMWGTAPYAIRSRRVATIPGERVDSVQALPRTFALPLQVEGDSELEIDQALGRLGAILSPSDQVRVIYRRPDGTEREILAYYAGGADALSATAEAGYHQRAVSVPLVLRAHWPYWRAAGTPLLTYGPELFDDGRSAGSNLVTITNGGDVATWPEIIITGYAEGIDVANLTTGEVWRIREILEEGDVLRIDTDPTTFGVYLNGTNFYGASDPISEWWQQGLVPGVNVLLLRGNTATGTEAIGTFTLRWRENFETP